MSLVVTSRLPCPKCPSSDAYHEYDDGHGYCFSCSYFKPKTSSFQEPMFTYEYIPLRGLNKSTLSLYDIKTKIDVNGKPVSVGFRYPWGDYKERFLDRKHFEWTKSDHPKHGLFGRDKFSSGSNKACVITEGEFDAPSLHQILGIPAVSVTSASAALADVTVDRSWVDSHERIYLAFDNDAAGRTALAAVAKLFDFNKIYVLKFDKRKDANEYLQVGETDELRNIYRNARRYLPETIISSFAEFEKILSETPTKGQPYPFPTLNDLTYGIRRGESVLITAQEGVGKTELMHSILHKILKETDDAVGAIFLEEPKGHLLRSLAGLELQRPVHLPDHSCSEVEIMEAIKKMVRVDDRLHVYSHFGSDDPDILLDTIRFQVVARGVAFLFLDHISMVVSALIGEDERRALDYISTRLEMMVKELNFALIFVSHVNDQGQTRGSRYISKIADIRIDAARDLMSADESVRNTTILTVPKNRFCGKTGAAGKYIFDPYTRQFTEASNDNIQSHVRVAA